MDDRTRKEMQEAMKLLNSPEAIETRRLLSRPEVREGLRHLHRPEGRVHLEELRRPEVRSFLEEIQRPDFKRFYEDTMRYAREMGAGRLGTDVPRFSLPAGFPFGASPPLVLDADAVRAASEVAGMAQAVEFRQGAADLARFARISLPSDAAMSAQLAAARRFLGSSLREAASNVSLASLEGARKNYAETLRQARALLSDPAVRRMVESADADALVAEGLEAAEGAPATAEEDLVVEEIEVLLGPDSDVEILLPWVNWSLIVFGIAWMVATGDPSFVEYKEPLEELMTKLGLLKTALEMYLGRRRGEGDG